MNTLDEMTKRSKLSMELSYASDSSDPDSDQDNSNAFGDLADDDDPGDFHSRNRRKRRKTGREARDRAALGVFGSDSDDDDNDRWSRSRRGGKSGRSLRHGGVAFVAKSEARDDDEEDDSNKDASDGASKKDDNGGDDDDDEEEEDDDDEGHVGLGLGSNRASGMGFGLGFNLGFNQATASETDKMDIDQGSSAEGDQEPKGGGDGVGSSTTSAKRGFLFAPRAVGSAASGNSGASTPRSLNTHAGLGFQSASDGSSKDASPQPEQSAGFSHGGRGGFGLGFKAAGTIDSTQLDAAPLPAAPPGGGDTPMLSNPLGKGFVSSAERMAMFAPQPMYEDTPQQEENIVARPSFTQADADDRKGKKKGKQAGGSGINGQSFAARMMAKMGYQEGKGLGKFGEGILKPIEVKLRPQGAGVGLIKEKTKQAKEEERRRKELQGEIVSDSDSEKERKQRKKRDAARRGGSETPASGTTTPGGTSKRKPKFRTAEEISQDAKGLEVPSVLKSIIDLTGKEAKTIDPGTPGLLSVGEPSKEEDPNVKIARMARRDLESFAAEWKTLQVRRKFVDVEEKSMNRDLDEQVDTCQRLDKILGFVGDLRKMSVSVPHTDLNEHESKVNELTEKLENMQVMYKDEIDKYGLSEAAVAAFHPLLKSAFVNWDPLHDPVFLLEPIRKLRYVFKIRTREDVEGLIANNLDSEKLGKSSSHYESMIYNVWLPKIRSAINNHWNVHDPTPVVTLLEAWSTVLPPFIQANILDQLVIPKLKAAVSSWNPRTANKKSVPPPPHVWVFPWLPYLGEHSEDLIREVKRKFRVILDQWDLSKGAIKGLEAWQEVFGPGELEKMLVHHLLPRLAELLRRDLSINPADQQLEPLDNVLQWHSFFRLSTFTQLLEAEFFPKWLQTLYSWLTSSSDDPNYDEISEWYQWWSGSVLPDALKQAPQVRKEFQKGLDMMNQALELGPGEVLTAPSAGPARPIRPSPPARTLGGSEKRHAKGNLVPDSADGSGKDFNSTFREYVDEWCTDHNLLLIPQRKAHEGTGQPLFRITESASGTGGVLCYFFQDVVWAQDRKKKDIFEPVGLDKIEKRLEQGHRH